ncbi:MAG: hypothetical protein HYV29_01795 [Ignavibacteriales bacterium]|nr:hypothetical protein [Ignavibacteriales bacterium]
MEQYDITLLTESRYVTPSSSDEYVQNILLEDLILRTALEKHRLRVARIDWADKNFDWSSTRIALFRTTWDYFHRFSEFLQWLDVVSKQTRLINPIELIRWNADKHYLRDLQEKGISIPPTRFIERGERVTLKDLHAEMNWKESVLKPTVSGGGRHTYKLHAENVTEHEEIFRSLISNEAMMLQPYLNSVETKGEIALMVIGGKYTHAVLKRAKPGDFRVQDDFGGTVHHYKPSQAEMQFAEEVVAQCDPLPAYARVDLIFDDQSQSVVSELELIEPELWFRFYPSAAEVLADAIAKNL